jgi:SAM-dependent methyltransferase
VWLALRGMEVTGIDVSPVAIDLARELASLSGVADRCRFEVHDLDDGLPDGPQMGLVFCHLFRDMRLDQAIIDRTAPGGTVAVATLSEVDAGPGQFRARPGELREAFGSLEVLAEGEANGIAWLIGRKDG